MPVARQARPAGSSTEWQGAAASADHPAREDRQAARTCHPHTGLTFRPQSLCVATSFPRPGCLPGCRGRTSANQRTTTMAKAANIKIKLLSTADTGFFYVTSKNSRTKTDKLSFRKYDPVAKKHVEFKETKIK
jgi:large subunit ribosomal protein L33